MGDPLAPLAQLRALDIRPKKGLGQNFLVDSGYRERIVAAAGLVKDDTVLEVGPGPGVLTDLLVRQAGQVIAVELDDRLIPVLRDRFANQPQVSIVHGDILEMDPGALVQKLAGDGSPSYKVVANLPYYITGALLRHLLECDKPPELLVLTVQREVADRMVARPPHMSLMALGVQFYCTAEIVMRIPAGSFYPVPKVDSAAVRLTRRSSPAVQGVAAEAYFRVARAGFSQPRKQLRNSLASGMGISPAAAAAWLERAGIDPQRRPETVTLEEWGRLVLAGEEGLAGAAHPNDQETRSS